MNEAQKVPAKRSDLVTALSAVGLVFGLLALGCAAVPLLGVAVFGPSLRRLYIPLELIGSLFSAANILTYFLGIAAILLCLTALIAAYAMRASKTLAGCSLVVGLLAVGTPTLTHAWYGSTLELFPTLSGRRHYVMRSRGFRGMDSSPRTPLMKAAEAGDTEKVKALLKDGADPRQKSGGWSACGLAVRAGRTETVRTLLEEAPQLTEDTKYMNGLVMVASQWGRTEIIRMLLDKGASANATNPRQANWTAVMEATQKGRTETALLLLENGADVNATNLRNWTALMQAAQTGDIEVATALLDRGASLNARDMYGNTALMMAAVNGHADVVDELLARGADYTLQTENGNTAMKYAAYGNHTDIVRLLAAAGAKR